MNTELPKVIQKKHFQTKENDFYIQKTDLEVINRMNNFSRITDKIDFIKDLYQNSSNKNDKNKNKTNGKKNKSQKKQVTSNKNKLKQNKYSKNSDEAIIEKFTKNITAQSTPIHKVTKIKIDVDSEWLESIDNMTIEQP